MSTYTPYEKQLMREAADDLYRVTRTLNALPIGLGEVFSCHHTVIQNCNAILHEMAEDMYRQSREEV